MAHGGRAGRSWTPGVLEDEMGTHISLAPLYAYAPIGERAFFKTPRNRGRNTTTLLTSLHQGGMARSEEHTSELQSRQYLVCRLLLEKKKIRHSNCTRTTSLTK